MTTETQQMSAIELRDIMAKQLRDLNASEMTDRNIAKKIDLAKQIFNGAGKMIALSAYVTEAQRLGMNGDILALPVGAKVVV